MRHTLLPRSIRRYLRRPSIHLAVAVALAMVTGVLAYRLLDAAQRGAARYGHPVPVAVALVDLRAGDRLDPASIEVRSLPAGAVPPTAVRTMSVGRVVRSPLAAGQVLVASDLTVPGTSPLSAALPPGTVALAVPRGDVPLRLFRGDRVDLLALTPEGAQRRVASRAKVLATAPHSLTVAVANADVGEVAMAITAGDIVPALRGS